MPSARELLEQADALMRRNRSAVIDTEIPELTEIVAMVAAPSAVPTATSASAAAAAAVPTDLDDVPELTEAVEEIEIESIVELPEDVDEPSSWLRHDHGPLSVVGSGTHSVAPNLGATNHPALNVERAARSALSVVGKDTQPAAPAATVTASVAKPAEAMTLPVAVAPAVAAADTPPASTTPAAGDELARWEVLADEIRMQVLQRIDIFTDTRLRDELAAQLQPIVDRASAEMVATINAHVGGLLRGYVAEAVEREIEKWRSGAQR